MHHVLNFGYGTHKVGQGNCTFSSVFEHERQKLVPHHQLAIMARVKKEQCCMGANKEVSLRELDARMLWFDR